MRRFILLLISIIISVSAFSQDVVKLGNELIDVTDMEDARFILVNNGMTIETSDKIFIDPNKQIIASNGSNVVCIVAAEKHSNHVASVTFISESMIDGLEENLSKLGYKAVSDTGNGEYCNGWKSHATLTLLAKQDLPTFGYNMIDPLKSWCWGSILFYPFKISRFS